MSPSKFGKWIHGIQILTAGNLAAPYLRSQVRVTYTQNKPHPVGSALWSHSEASSSFVLYRGIAPDSYILDVRCQGRGAFTYRDHEIQVYWEPGGTNSDHYFHSLGLAFWLEQQNIPCLHANSLIIDGHGVGLMARSQTGKSTLTAALLQRGHTLLADDMLPLHNTSGQWQVFPGLASIRLWPDSGSQFTTAQAMKDAPRVHQHFEKRRVDLGTESNQGKPWQAKPLSAIYTLNRITGNNKDAAKIQTLTPAQAMLTLLENSLIGGAPRVMDVEAQRFKQFARLLTQVPVKQLRYSSGFQQLDEVCELLKTDISQLHQQNRL
ncbi:MAG: hypothetical protein L3J26_05795 [Candidatus Polarisedimenticolaceae bacterium]|nr:hypothetical protein [Candidatus Polarisedimenticolaceae bacterium]